MLRSIPAFLLSAALLFVVGCTDATVLGPDGDAERRAPGHRGVGVPLAAGPNGGVFPDVIALPNGFQPEGIALGPGTSFYAGSLISGAIVRGDLRTGMLHELVPGNGAAAGMEYDARSGLLWVATSGVGGASAYDAATGALVQTYSFGGGLINDVAVTREAAFFTDSFSATLFVVPLGRGGAAPEPGAAYTLPLTGEYEGAPAPLPGFPLVIDANGIVATPNGTWLLVVNTTSGHLYRVDPATGEAHTVDLGGADPLVTADGMVLHGKTLYVLQNFLNQIAVVDLSRDFLMGEVTSVVTNADLEGAQLDIPATAVRFGNALYVVNANFDDASPFDPDPETLPNTPFEVVRVPMR